MVTGFDMGSMNSITNKKAFDAMMKAMGEKDVMDAARMEAFNEMALQDVQKVLDIASKVMGIIGGIAASGG